MKPLISNNFIQSIRYSIIRHLFGYCNLTHSYIEFMFGLFVKSIHFAFQPGDGPNELLFVIFAWALHAHYTLLSLLSASLQFLPSFCLFLCTFKFFRSQIQTTMELLSVHQFYVLMWPKQWLEYWQRQQLPWLQIPIWDSDFWGRELEAEFRNSWNFIFSAEKIGGFKNSAHFEESEISFRFRIPKTFQKL